MRYCLRENVGTLVNWPGIVGSVDGWMNCLWRSKVGQAKSPGSWLAPRHLTGQAHLNLRLHLHHC